MGYLPLFYFILFYFCTLPLDCCIVLLLYTISDTVNTIIEATGDFLPDNIKFEFNGTIEIEETCMTSYGVVTNKWRFVDLAYIELPISCSISSKEIKYGALKLTSDEVVVVEIKPARMATIRKTNTWEKKVMISEAEFRGNVTEKENVVVRISGAILGLNKFYWILMGAASGTLVLLIFCSVSTSTNANHLETARPTLQP